MASRQTAAEDSCAVAQHSLSFVIGFQVAALCAGRSGSLANQHMTIYDRVSQ